MAIKLPIIPFGGMGTIQEVTDKKKKNTQIKNPSLKTFM